MKLASFSALIGSAAAFPALINLGGDGDAPLLDLTGKGGLIDISSIVNSSTLSVLQFNQDQAQNTGYAAADPKNCPFNKDHKPAAKWNPDFPYSGARNGLPGNGKGGYQVPAPGDDDHKFIAPGPNDIRGPYVIDNHLVGSIGALLMKSSAAPA